MGLRRHTEIHRKIAALRGAALQRRGKLIAHHTGTLPGIAAMVGQDAALSRLVRFKQRNGPFLLLADSLKTAAHLARYYSPILRQMMKKNWPGAVTLLFPGRPGLPDCCYKKGYIAVRVDAALQTRQLAHACGGLLLSSSLNRRGGLSRQAGLDAQMRWHRFIAGRAVGVVPSGQASSLILIRGNHSTVIRR